MPYMEGDVLDADASAVAAGDADLALEISVTPFTVSTNGGTATISFDFNVENWIDLQSLDDGVIPDGRITGQVTAVVTSG